ncbi:MAG: Kelch repeat-containing protein [Planctomycetota bacterium]
MRSLLNASLLASTLATLLPAQGSFELDKVTDGSLGQSLILGYDQAPAGASLLFMFSVGSGPIPLAAIDPSDPRSLAVGLEFAGSWQVTNTGTGAGGLALPIPNTPALAGGLLHLQALTFPGTSLVFGALSNPVTQQLGSVGTPVALPRNLVQARALTQSFRVGRDVMLAGGGQGSLLGATGLASTERYDARTMRVAAGPTMGTARALAFSAVLQDGRVLLVGGVDGTGAVLSSAEIYDPATDQFTPAASMAVARAAFDGALLNDGRVLVAGGTTTFVDAVSALANAQSSVEIYNPATNTWSNAAGMADRLIGPDLTTLADGRVLLSGGFDVDSFFGIPIPVGSIRTSRLYNPTNNTWGNAATMQSSRGAHGPNTVRLQDGRVLVTGGAQSGPDLTQAASIAGAEIYNPSTNTWTALPPLPQATAIHAVSVIADGRVVVTGGASGTLTTPVEHANALVFQPLSNSWTVLPNLPTARAGHVSMSTDDGVLVLFGGQTGGGATSLATTVTIRP